MSLIVQSNQESEKEEIPSKSIQKGIQKLEEFGKRGKLQRIVTITVEHFEFLK